MNRKYTKENLQEAVGTCTKWSDVCDFFGVKAYSGAQTHIKRRADHFKVDYSHFPGQGWNRGKEATNKKPLSEFLVNGRRCNSSSLRKRLIKEGIKEASCEHCGISKWNGQDAPLELDHINKNHEDNSLENLRILCANCHSLV